MNAMCIWMYVRLSYSPKEMTKLAGAIEYTDCISAERGKTPQWVSWIWHETISWWGSSNAGLWGMQCAPSLPSLLGPLWPKVVAPDRLLFMGQIKLFNIQTVYKQTTC